MKIHALLLTLLSFRLLVTGCECEHVYDEDVIAAIDAQEDVYNDDYLYDLETCAGNLQTQNPYPHLNVNPDKLYQQAAYAFDSFKYHKCLEKIREYEKKAFPPPQTAPIDKKITILAYKAYCKKYLSKYDSAIEHFEELISLIKRNSSLAPECQFITYLEHAQCYLLKGDREEYRNRIKKIFDMNIAPSYEYFANNGFIINHQPCFHDHAINKQEAIIFNQIAPELLGQELFAMMQARGQTPKFYTVAQNGEDIEFCRRWCHRANYLTALIVGCITKKKEAIVATIILGELLVDCETCCKEGWGSSNCLEEIKKAFWLACQQQMLDGL